MSGLTRIERLADELDELDDEVDGWMADGRIDEREFGLLKMHQALRRRRTERLRIISRSQRRSLRELSREALYGDRLLEGDDTAGLNRAMLEGSEHEPGSERKAA